jgi:hypothetical protein
MSNVSTPNVIAILCSDIHLSEKPPTFRSSEDDWFEAMARPLRQLDDLAAQHKAPIVCAGDVFDKWDSNPELINFAIAELPFMYAIAGQHDLPHHQYKDIHRSAYWTLVCANAIQNIPYNEPIELTGLTLHGFQWEAELYPCEAADLSFHLAVVHRYIWNSKENSYTGASETSHVRNTLDKIAGFHAAVFGDNHKGFLLGKTKKRGCVLNNGGFMRRRKDEIHYEPSVGLLLDDGTIERYKLDCSQDKYLKELEKETQTEEQVEMSRFIAELQELGSDSLDFKMAVELFCKNNKIHKRIHSMIMEALQE